MGGENKEKQEVDWIIMQKLNLILMKKWGENDPKNEAFFDGRFGKFIKKLQISNMSLH